MVYNQNNWFTNINWRKKWNSIFAINNKIIIAAKFKKIINHCKKIDRICPSASNNLYSVYSPLDVRQPAARSRVAIAEAHGMIARHGDGNDVEEVYRIAQESIQAIRKGQGPIFLEFDTYRHREHCGPNYDNDIGYRTEEEFQQWETKCPLKLYAKEFAEQLPLLRNEITKEIEEAFAFAENSPFPKFELEAENPYA